jgi:hypothetical protein
VTELRQPERIPADPRGTPEPEQTTVLARDSALEHQKPALCGLLESGGPRNRTWRCGFGDRRERAFSPVNTGFRTAMDSSMDRTFAQHRRSPCPATHPRCARFPLWPQSQHHSFQYARIVRQGPGWMQSTPIGTLCSAQTAGLGASPHCVHIIRIEPLNRIAVVDRRGYSL